MKRKKTLWLICMAGLCLVLYTIVASRVARHESIIFPGADGTYVSSDSATYADVNAVETPEPTEDIWPKIDIDLPQYSMVNDENLLSAVYTPTDTSVISITNQMRFDTAALPHLEDMLQAVQDAGFTVYVAGAYRSYSFQEQLFNGKASQIAASFGVYDYMDPRYQDAVAEARTITAFPGASEHQLGLAVDLMDKPYSSPMVYANMNQEFFEWLDAHCAEYGFIKRYPTRKLLLTGWDEPWHYRYVGVEAATFIMENGLCYEEFYAHYVPEFEY